jgi:hypothetical protein
MYFLVAMLYYAGAYIFIVWGLILFSMMLCNGLGVSSGACFSLKCFGIGLFWISEDSVLQILPVPFVIVEFDFKGRFKNAKM